MSLGERMLQYRAKEGLSTKKAAEKAKISDQTWRYVEKGLQDATPITQAKIELLIGKEDK